MNRTLRSFHKGFVLAIAGAALLGPAAYAAEPASEDPVAVAESFEKQAVDLRAMADRHEKLAKMHRGGMGSSKVNHESMVQHCDKIAKDLRAAAKESEAAAAEARKSALKK